MLAIRLPKDLEKRLDNMAKRTGRTKTYYARQAIVEQLDDLEDLYLAERRLEDAESGRSETVPLDEFLAERGFIK
jgi:RHH-type rel operon transcriptional repressor/antitoxin RelB